MPQDPRDITPQGLPVGWYDATKGGSNFSFGCLKYVLIAGAIFFGIVTLASANRSSNPAPGGQPNDFPVSVPDETFAEPLRKGTRSLSVGDCYSDGISPDTVFAAECSESHDGEVVGIAFLGEGSFPVGGVSDQRAVDACNSYFSASIRRKLSDASLMFDSSKPSETEWDSGDRSLVCMIERGFHEAPLVGGLS